MRIRRDLPLKEDTDLFKYGIHDRSFAGRLDSLVADLLDAGHAMVDFWPLHEGGPYLSNSNDQYDPVTLKRVYWTTRGGDGRKYCSENGHEILFIVDEIVD